MPSRFRDQNTWLGMPRWLRIGGQGKRALRQQLRSRGVGLNRHAEMLFDDPRFVPAARPRYLRLACVTAAVLGLPDGATYPDLQARAWQMGLVPCPLEVGPWLRLASVGPAHRSYLHIASHRLRKDADYPNGFYLRRYQGRSWLRGYRATPDWQHAPDAAWVFVVAGRQSGGVTDY